MLLAPLRNDLLYWPRNKPLLSNDLPTNLTYLINQINPLSL